MKKEVKNVSQELKPEFQHYLDKGLEIVRKQKEKDLENIRRIETQNNLNANFQIAKVRGDDKESEETHYGARIGRKVIHHADTEEELKRMIEEFQDD